MEHDDARDRERRADEHTPTDPTPTDPTSIEAADRAELRDAAERTDAVERPDAVSGLPSMADAPIADAEPRQSWPEQDLSARPEPSAEETWPERVEPEAPAAWPSADSPAPMTEPGTADAFDRPAMAETEVHATLDRDAPGYPEPSREPESSGPPPSEAEAFDAAGATAAGAASATAAHAVPATNVSESTRCPRCGTENRPGLAFCSNCGQRLVAAGASTTLERPGTPEGTQACPRCGTHNRAGVAFCQNCGANLRPAAAPGYVPPAVAAEAQPEVAAQELATGGAILGPIVLLIGAIGIAVGWLLPFPYGNGSLFDRAFGAGGYGAAFWNGYPDVTGGLADQAYFGFAGPAPLFVALLVVLAIAGFMRAVPGSLQRIGLGLALIWALGLIVLFLVAEVFASWSGDIVGLLRDLSPGGIIFFLASLIVLIGTLTRFARS